MKAGRKHHPLPLSDAELETGGAKWDLDPLWGIFETFSFGGGQWQWIKSLESLHIDNIYPVYEDGRSESLSYSGRFNGMISSAPRLKSIYIQGTNGTHAVMSVSELFGSDTVPRLETLSLRYVDGPAGRYLGEFICRHSATLKKVVMFRVNLRNMGAWVTALQSMRQKKTFEKLEVFSMQECLDGERRLPWNDKTEVNIADYLTHKTEEEPWKTGN